MNLDNELDFGPVTDPYEDDDIGEWEDDDTDEDY